MHTEPTSQDILNAINSFANVVENCFNTLEHDVSGLKSDVSDLKVKASNSEKDIANIKNQMVTKHYLDEKLYDLRGDLILLTRKEDAKLGTLVDILEKREIISQNEARQVLSLEPFSK